MQGTGNVGPRVMRSDRAALNHRFESRMSPDHNVPGRDEVVIDHVGLFVPEMAQAARAFEQLGFRLTPLSPQRHRLGAGGPLVAAGTANRLALLTEGYVEILTPVADTPVARQLREASLGYAGLHLIAFGTGDARAAQARLAGAGFAPQPVIELERTVDTPISEGLFGNGCPGNGLPDQGLPGNESPGERLPGQAPPGEELARFSVVRVPPDTMPEGRIQFCQQHTPELVWQSRWVEQPNRARALTDVLLSVADPAETAARFARFVGREPENAGAAWWLTLTRGRIAFVHRARLVRLFPEATLPERPFMTAFGLSTDDLARTRATLARNGLNPFDLGDGVLAAAIPGGVAGTVCFLAQGASPPWLA